jgi:hypothetical protein
MLSRDNLRSKSVFQPATVARVFVASPTVHWLKPDLDVERDRADVEARMGEVARKHGRDVRCTGGELLRQDSEVEGWLRKYSPADAIPIFPTTAPAGPLNALVNAAPAPMPYFHRPCAGHSWPGVGGWQQAGKRIAIVASQCACRPSTISTPTSRSSAPSIT